MSRYDNNSISFQFIVHNNAFMFLEQLCLPLAHTRPPTSKQLDYIGEIIDEFVFCEVDRKGAKRKVRHIDYIFLFCLLIHFAPWNAAPESSARTSTLGSVTKLLFGRSGSCYFEHSFHDALYSTPYAKSQSEPFSRSFKE